MSYIRADEALPRELVEKIQQYVNGTVLYVPSRERKTGEAGPMRSAFMKAATRRS